jgi:energy-coupling factor transport system substrate-specific component
MMQIHDLDSAPLSRRMLDVIEKARMFTPPRLILIALGAALNFSIGVIVYLVKLPVYLDSVGTILVALLLAPDRMAAFLCAWAAGWASLAVSGLVNPFVLWFAVTDVAIALVAALFVVGAAATFRARPLRSGAFGAHVALCGVALGVVSAIVSVPVVVYVFGGVTGSGSAFLVAFFLKAGQPIMSAAMLAGLVLDPIDKILQVLLAALLYRATPGDFIALLRG